MTDPLKLTAAALVAFVVIIAWALLPYAQAALTLPVLR